MSFQTLITASELDHLCRTETDVVILDARFHLDDEDWGDRAFAESHIPGAQRASLATDLSGPIIEGITGRRPFPASADFERTVRSWGIGPTTQVVVYDADRGLMAASRVWLMMRWIGH
ncbi:MAG: sulfurtransferase, partial [Candidatus Nanopelagicales bacterium]|nr:sulfurtransferase [Candidatus Nanopelagicales bacterium]